MPRKPTGNPVGRPPSQTTKLVRAVEQTLAQQNGAPTLSQYMRRFSARYDAAGRGRRMAGWNAPSSGPNLAQAGLQTIRDRARDSTRNDWSAESSIQKWTTNLIGIGITPRWKRLKNKVRKQEITDLWNAFVNVSDADCVLNYYGQQSLVTRSWLESGEVFARYRARFLDEGLPVPFQVQLLEADMVPMLDTDNYEGLPVGNRIRSGIELNKRGKRVAYWVFKEHPGENQSTYTSDSLIRVAASEMLHIFEQKRVGQLRGVPSLASILARLRNIENYDDATLERQKLANMVVGFIKRTLPALPADMDIDPATGLPIEVSDTGTPLMGMQPGLIQELEDGQDVTWSNPPEAGTTYSDYMRTQHLGTAAGGGMPYEVMSGDIANVSDRTLRVMINEFRRFAEQRQWQILIPMFAQRVIDWFVDGLVLTGKATIEEAAELKRVEHAPHGWAHIHPVQDPQGKALEVTSGFRSRASVVGAMGDDVDDVDAERQEDDEREQKLKIGEYSEAAALKRTPADAATKNPAVVPDDPEDNADRKVQALQIGVLEAQMASLNREPAPPWTPPAPAPVEPDPLLVAIAARLAEPVPAPVAPGPDPLLVALAARLAEPPVPPAPAPAPVVPVATRRVIERNGQGLIVASREFAGDKLIRIVRPVRDAQGFITESTTELV